MREQILHYKLESLLGKGGMGEVYLAEDTNRFRKVAIKVLPEGTQANEMLREQFAQEIRAASTLGHPNLVNVLDGGETDGVYYMVMELIEGKGLDHLLKQTTKIVFPMACFILGEVLTGLEYLHNGGIFHRDIKPPNVMITNRGQVKITDFGILKDIGKGDAGGSLVGTPSFMAPEQIQGGKYDHRVDIYACGVMFFQMLVGFNPFLSDSLPATIGRVLSHNPAPVYTFDTSIPFEFQALIDKMVAKDADFRYARVKEALDELKELVSKFSVHVDGNDFRAYLENPERETTRIRKLLSERYFFTSQEQFIRGEIPQRVYMFDLYRAHLLNPASTTIKAQLDEICRDIRVEYTLASSSELRQLGRAYAADPDDFEVLNRLLEFYNERRLMFHAFVMARALMRVRPNNAIVKRRFEEICATFSSQMLAQRLEVWKLERADLFVSPDQKETMRIQREAEEFIRLQRELRWKRFVESFDRVFFLKTGFIAITVAFFIMVVPFATSVFERDERLFPSTPIPEVPRWLPLSKYAEDFLNLPDELTANLQASQKLLLGYADDGINQRDFYKAEKNLRQLVPTLANQWPIRQRCAYNLGVVLEKLESAIPLDDTVERLQEGRHYLADANGAFLQTLRETLADTPQQLVALEATWHRGKVLEEMRMLDLAEAAFAKMFALGEELPPPFHPETVEMLLEYPRFLEKRGDLGAAEEKCAILLRLLADTGVRRKVIDTVMNMYLSEHAGPDPEAAAWFALRISRQAPDDSPEKDWGKLTFYQLTQGTGIVGYKKDASSAQPGVTPSAMATP